MSEPAIEDDDQDVELSGKVLKALTIVNDYAAVKISKYNYKMLMKDSSKMTLEQLAMHLEFVEEIKRTPEK